MRIQRRFPIWLTTASLALLVSTICSSARAETMKVYLLIGQSNMEGQAYTYDNSDTAGWNIPTMEFLVSGTAAATNYLSNMPFEFKDSVDASWLLPRTDAWGVHYRSSNGALRDILPTDDMTGTDIVTGIQPLSPGFGAGTGFGSMFGPELGMGIRLADTLDSPVFLFKSDQGGTDLAYDWRPPSAVTDRGGAIGANYTNTLNQFTSFLDGLDQDIADGVLADKYGGATGYEVVGLAWFQGWNTTNGSQTHYSTTQKMDEYVDNLVDLVQDVRASDSRIPNDLGVIVGESSDQNAALNVSRAAAVDALNFLDPGTAVFVENNDMKSVDWGNNELGASFSQGWGFHFHARAENFLEIGWQMGGAAIDNGFIGGVTPPPPPPPPTGPTLIGDSVTASGSAFAVNPSPQTAVIGPGADFSGSLFDIDVGERSVRLEMTAGSNQNFGGLQTVTLSDLDWDTPSNIVGIENFFEQDTPMTASNVSYTDDTVTFTFQGDFLVGAFASFDLVTLRAVSAVPEPTSLVGWVFGILGLGWYRRWLKRRSY